LAAARTSWVAKHPAAIAQETALHHLESMFEIGLHAVREVVTQPAPACVQYAASLASVDEVFFGDYAMYDVFRLTSPIAPRVRARSVVRSSIHASRS
jgi:hypothetical protein